MPPGKGRDGAHISMPTELKERLIKEADRRHMTISDLVVEKVLHADTIEHNQRLDIQHVLEAQSRKLDLLIERTSVAYLASLVQRSKPQESSSKPLTPMLEENTLADEPAPKFQWWREKLFGCEDTREAGEDAPGT